MATGKHSDNSRLPGNARKIGLQELSAARCLSNGADSSTGVRPNNRVVDKWHRIRTPLQANILELSRVTDHRGNKSQTSGEIAVNYSIYRGLLQA